MWPRQTGRRILATAAVALLAVNLVLHFVDLDADAPSGLSNSAGAYFDTYANAHSARSFVLFGDLRPDEWEPLVYSPTFTLLQVLWFWVAGTDAWATNAFGAILSAIALLLWLGCLRAQPAPVRWIACFLLAVNHPLLFFGRLGLFENAMLLFMAASLCCLGGRRTTPWQAAGAGFFAMLAYASKAIGIYLLPAAAAGVAVAAGRTAYETDGRQAGWQLPAAALAGWLTAFVPWLLGFRIPNEAIIARIGDRWKEIAMPRSIPDVVEGLTTSPLLQWFAGLDPLWMAAAAATGWIAYRGLRRPLSVEPVAVVLAVWLVGGGVLVSSLRFYPTRYAYPMLPCMLILAAYGLGWFVHRSRIVPRPGCPALAYPMEVLLLFLFVHFAPCSPLGPLHRGPGMEAAMAARVGIELAAVAPAWLAARMIASRTLRGPVLVPRAALYTAVLALCLVPALGHMKRTRHWLRHRRHTVVETSRALRPYPAMVLAGTSANAAAAETDHRVVRVGLPGWFNDRDPIGRYGVTHLLLTDYGGELRRFNRLYPKEMRRARLVRNVEMCGYPYHLFALERGPPSTDGATSREGEALTRNEPTAGIGGPEAHSLSSRRSISQPVGSE